MVRPEHIDEVEVQQKQRIAGPAQQHQRPRGEDAGDYVLPAQTHRQRGKQRQQQAAVHQDVGHVGDRRGEERSQRYQAGARHQGALARGQHQAGLQFAQRNPGQEGADVGERSVLEHAQPEAVAVAVDRPGQVVRIQENVERVRHQPQRPESQQ